MTRKRVLVTGAAGWVAGRILPALRPRYDLTLLDVSERDGQGKVVAGVQQVDLLAGDNHTAYQAHFQHVHTVIHLARLPLAPGGRMSPDQLPVALRELKMAYRMYRLALEAGVDRVINASSIHASSWLERQVLAGRRDHITPYEKAMADNVYGWSRETSEHMGFVFAAGELGRQLGVVQIRIGGPREFSYADFAGRPQRYKRQLASYVSARDLQQLVVGIIETKELANPDLDGVPFHIFYGLSDNTRRFWALANARQTVAYEPEDDAELSFGGAVRRFLREAGDEAAGTV